MRRMITGLAMAAALAAATACTSMCYAAEVEPTIDCAETVEVEAYGDWIPVGTFRVTHYDDCYKCCGHVGQPTASGAMPQLNHTVAANKADFPFGTRLLINGQEYVVEDRGCKKGVIDIFVDTHQHALELGAYKTEIYVLRR